MMKLNTKVHGIIDYLVVAFLWISPSLFGLPPVTSAFTYVLGGIHLALTIGTDFELGLVKVIPVKIHGWIELVVSIILVGVAFYLGSTQGDASRNFYLVFSLAVFITWAITRYEPSIQ